ncbi:MAG: hypothetical protein WB699_13075 [Bacteroidota bacterium]
MASRFLVLAVFLGVVGNTAFCDVIRDGSLSAESQSNGVLIRWTTNDETGVSAFRIERSLPDGSGFIVLVQRLPAKGSGQTYQFVDETAFRTTDSFYRYRVTPIDEVGSEVGGQQFYTGLISSRVSSVRRTWGSIKAMFR